MKNYYTPSIEEFHVGFECEAIINNKMWIPLVMNGVGQDVIDYHKSNLYRVKFLAIEDILSLGFGLDNNAEPIPSRADWNVPQTDDHKLPLAFIRDLQLTTGEAWMLYLYDDGTVWIEYTKDCCGMGYLFKGNIKNKSELKKVLTQIGVGYETT